MRILSLAFLVFLSALSGAILVGKIPAVAQGESVARIAPSSGTTLSPAPAMDGPVSFADLVSHLTPSVVNISSTQKAEEQDEGLEAPQFPPGSPFEDFFDEFMKRRGLDAPSVPVSSLGSGFIVDAEKGYIVTNNHVVKDADEVRVTFHDDLTVPAEIVGRDEKTDIALLKVTPNPKHPLTAVSFGDSDVMRVGDWVVAIGNPFGLGGTVTAGIVSARQRDINAGPYDDFIQTDASINRGNSGGPMFNLKGEVIGINTAIFSPSGGSVGIGFAIPSSLASRVVEQIVSYGHTRRGWLGIRIQTVTEDIAESLGLKETTGALVAGVMDKGPAKAAGLKSGDVILSFDGKKIDAMRSLPRTVAETPIGKDVEVTYWRDGKEGHVRVTVGELEKAEKDGLVPSSDADGDHKPGKGVEVPGTGLTLGGISDSNREEFRIPDDVQGVLVVAVADMSEAAEKGFLVGDVIMEINQQAVSTPEDAASVIEKAGKGGRNSVLLLVNREGDVRFVALRLKKE